MKYQTRVVEVEAAQYFPGEEIDLPVKLIKYEGVGGYAGRLSYLKNPKGDLMTVRPSDWIVLSEGLPPKILTDDEFHTTYELTKQARRAKKSSTEPDNTHLRVPGTS